MLAEKWEWPHGQIVMAHLSRKYCNSSVQERSAYGLGRAGFVGLADSHPLWRRNGVSLDREHGMPGKSLMTLKAILANNQDKMCLLSSVEKMGREVSLVRE